MITATRLALPAAVLMLGGALVAPGTAAATPQNTCIGHIAKGTPAADALPDDHPVTFAFACGFPVNGFSLVSGNEVAGFDTDLSVFDLAQNLVAGEMFSCEGDEPGFGVNCNGAYGGGFHVISGTFLTTADPCVEPREDVRLVVSYASLSSKGVLSNSVAGPFELGRPRGCPTVSHKPVKVKGKAKKKGRRAGLISLAG